MYSVEAQNSKLQYISIKIMTIYMYTVHIIIMIMIIFVYCCNYVSILNFSSSITHASLSDQTMSFPFVEVYYIFDWIIFFSGFFDSIHLKWWLRIAHPIFFMQS
jgi:hypothetical protein